MLEFVFSKIAWWKHFREFSEIRWWQRSSFKAMKFVGNDRAVTLSFLYFLNKVNNPSLPYFHYFFLMFHYFSCSMSFLVSLQNYSSLSSFVCYPNTDDRYPFNGTKVPINRSSLPKYKIRLTKTRDPYGTKFRGLSFAKLRTYLRNFCQVTGDRSNWSYCILMLGWSTLYLVITSYFQWYN